MQLVWFKRKGAKDMMLDQFLVILETGKEAGSLCLVSRDNGNEILLKEEDNGTHGAPIVPMPLPLEYRQRQREGWVVL